LLFGEFPENMYFVVILWNGIILAENIFERRIFSQRWLMNVHIGCSETIYPNHNAVVRGK
jgi:hypothetical protein